MTALLEQLAPVVSAVLGYVTTVCTTIVSNPILLLVSGIMLLGSAVGIFGRMLSRS